MQTTLAASPTAFYDALETRSAAQREADWMAQLPLQIAHAKLRSPAFAQILCDVDPAQVNSRSALARVPVTRKHALLALQLSGRGAGAGAMGGLTTQPWGAGVPRVFASPGPIYEPEGPVRDYWRMARAIHAAGFRAGDLIHNCFSYHFVPAGAMMEGGAHALGCSVFAGGTGQTEQQVQAMADLQPAGYIGTPSFLKIIFEKADQLGVALPSVRKALFSGEAFPPSLRDWFTARGVQATQCYATADVGLIAYETQARAGLVVDEGIVLEIVRPGTGEPVPDGEVGEVVVTSLSQTYPLVRFGTGDLSAILPGPCPSGRTAPRIRGWLGRADQTTKVRGMFIHPEQVHAIVQRFPEVTRARLVVSGEMANDQMLLKVESACSGPDSLSDKLRETVREVTKLRADVQVLAPGSLPNDGKVIEDARSYR